MMKFLSKQFTNEELEAATKELHNFARISTDSDNVELGFTLDVIRRIVEVMRQFPKDVEIQRTACKIISNVAINSDKVTDIVSAGAIQYIKVAVETHGKNASVAWLGCSALWNIAQIREYREHIGLDGIDLVLRVIQEHQKEPNVQETAVGALANLAVNSKYKTIIGSRQNLNLFYTIMNMHAADARVQTSMSGLLTNLAHNATLSKLIGETSGAKFVIAAMVNHPEDPHLQRNACAALSNLTTVDDNAVHVIRNYGTEALYKSHDMHDQFGVRQLAQIALDNLGVRGDSKITTSLHMACALPKESEALSVVQEILLSGRYGVNDVNGEDKTPLDIAIAKNSRKLVEYLVTVGAQPAIENAEAMDVDTLTAISAGQSRNAKVNDVFIQTIYDTRLETPMDVARFMVQEFCDPVQMTHTLQGSVDEN